LIAARLPATGVIAASGGNHGANLPSVSEGGDTVPSQVYDLFSLAIVGRKQVLCLYDVSVAAATWWI
jgi:hypothetical protein